MTVLIGVSETNPFHLSGICNKFRQLGCILSIYLGAILRRLIVALGVYKLYPRVHYRDEYWRWIFDVGVGSK